MTRGGPPDVPRDWDFFRLVNILSTADWDEEIAELLSRVWVNAVFAAALENRRCLRIVVRYAGSATGINLPASNVGSFRNLPQELAYVVFSLITLPDRIRLASTCLTLKLMHSEYVQHQLTVVLASFGLDFCAVRLMLVATGSLMTGYAFQSILGGNILEQDTVDFYTTNRSTINVLMFLARSSGALSPTTANATWYTAWTLKIRGRTVRVIEHTSDPLEAILVCQESHIMGYCDGTRVRHAYGGLVLDGIALATRCSMPVERTLSEQQDIWNVLHAAIAHGFKWSYDLPGPHTCGVNPYCPCTPRSTKDGGWLTLHLPCANYGTAPFTDDGTWSLYGSGCTAGILEGGSLTRISRYDDDEWYSTIEGLMVERVCPSQYRAY